MEGVNNIANTSEEHMNVLEYFATDEFWTDSLAVSLLVSLVVFSLVLMYLGNLFHNITRGIFPKAYVEKKKKVAEETESAVLKALTDVVPIEEEHTILMDHEYDGIKELDNNLPPWWLYGFYFCILWGAIYFTHYHVLELGDLSADEYNAEILQAKKEVAEFKATQKNLITADNVMYLEDAASIAEGRDLFTQHCSACHLEDGRGEIGPNLTDEYWLNGGDIKSIFTIVKSGKKEMPSWLSTLKPKGIQKVISFINTIQGSNPPGAKAKEGVIYKAE